MPDKLKTTPSQVGLTRTVRLLRPLAFAVALALTLDGLPSQAAEEILDAYTEPYQVIRLAAPEAGLLQKLLIRPGEAIQAGQVVAELDSTVLAAELAAAKTRAAANGRRRGAAARSALRKSRLEKIRLLYAEQSAAPEELQRGEADVAIADANLQTAAEEEDIAASQVVTIAAQLERRRIRSPIDGIVATLHKEPGEFVNATAPEVATIVRLDVLKVKLHLPQSIAAKLHCGQTVELSLLDSWALPAKVEFVAPVHRPGHAHRACRASNRECWFGRAFRRTLPDVERNRWSEQQFANNFRPVVATRGTNSEDHLHA